MQRKSFSVSRLLHPPHISAVCFRPFYGSIAQDVPTVYWLDTVLGDTGSSELCDRSSSKFGGGEKRLGRWTEERVEEVRGEVYALNMFGRVDVEQDKTRKLERWAPADVCEHACVYGRHLQ